MSPENRAGHFGGLLWLAVLLVAGLAAISGQAAENPKQLRGVALVIGNGDYAHLPALTNPENDARAIENLLDDLGFETELSSDRDARRLRRDLEYFVEDAAGADVAIVYYAGHGIEAGGENWLVPVDAELDALDIAGKKLVPVSSVVERLQQTVPVVIMLLDACRDNPFPPGSVLKFEESSEGVPVSVAGLGEMRGARVLSRADKQADNLGTVIGFAAEPGRAALDGQAGENSPYAAAILRHIETLAGQEFGTVMRMVAEEVYLKTSGVQRPWINENLRRLLYFGVPVSQPADDAGEIVAERRQLLLTIATLEEYQRRSLETIASNDGIPLDAIFAMLSALGEDAPSDPLELERVMRSQAKRVKEILADREALTSTDPEIQKLSRLADKAIEEGAIKSAIRFLERAKENITALDSSLDRTEAELKARRIEAGEVYAKSAETYELAFEHLKAAEDYARAYGQVARWDDRLAWQYKNGELVSLTEHGDYNGDNDALKRAIAAGYEAKVLAERVGDRDYLVKTYLNQGFAFWRLGSREADRKNLENAIKTAKEAIRTSSLEQNRQQWAEAQNLLGLALWILGERSSETIELEQAAAAYRASLEVYSRADDPLNWAMVHNNIGNTLFAAGLRETGTESLEQAALSYRAALEEYRREDVPLDWAATKNNLGNVLQSMGERLHGDEMLQQAVETYREALLERRKDLVPLDWAQTQYNLGITLQALGYREGGTETLELAAAAYRNALQERTRERVPLEWALTLKGLGRTLWMIGERNEDADKLEQAVEALDASLQELNAERIPMEWALANNDLGLALWTIGSNEGDTARLQMAAEAFHEALGVLTRDRVPLDWAMVQNNLGNVLLTTGELEGDTGKLQQAITAYRNALTERTRDRVPLDWALTQNNLGYTLGQIGKSEGDTGLLRQAATALENSLLENPRESVPLEWARTKVNLGLVLRELGKLTGDTDILSAGRHAVSESWDGYHSAGYEEHDEYFSGLITEIDAELEKMR